MANEFVGTWNTSWTGGAHQSTQLTINADGTGSYGYQNGTVTGSFGTGNLSYTGTWTQQQPPNQISGEFTFVLTGSTSFVGGWAMGDTPGGSWNGTLNS